jgi:hypothetical protein
MWTFLSWRAAPEEEERAPEPVLATLFWAPYLRNLPLAKWKAMCARLAEGGAGGRLRARAEDCSRAGFEGDMDHALSVLPAVVVQHPGKGTRCEEQPHVYAFLCA